MKGRGRFKSRYEVFPYDILQSLRIWSYDIIEPERRHVVDFVVFGGRSNLRRRAAPLLPCVEYSGTSKKAHLALQWRHNGRDSVSNHQPHDCFLNRLFRRRSKKISKLRVTGLCAGNSQGTGEFPAQMASNAENISIWWRHHESGPKYEVVSHEAEYKFDLKTPFQQD